MAEALCGASDLLVVGVPTFGWAEGRYFLVKSGSGAEIARYLEARPEDAEDVMLVLRYFDAMNFAGMIPCGTLIGLGLHDPVVPAETVYSIANHLSAPCEIMEFPVSHTALPEEKRWEQFEARWLAIGRGETELRPSVNADAGLTARPFPPSGMVPHRATRFDPGWWPSLGSCSAQIRGSCSPLSMSRMRLAPIRLFIVTRPDEPLATVPIICAPSRGWGGDFKSARCIPWHSTKATNRPSLAT